jgi:hypothetical protein
MTTLTEASPELFSRSPDERFESLQALWDHCFAEKQASRNCWVPPDQLRIQPNGRLGLVVEEEHLIPNDWSFGQLCRLAGVTKDTVNRLRTDTDASAAAGIGRSDTNC